MIAHTDELLAVWDGRPARGYGGMADVVKAAREQGYQSRLFGPQVQRAIEWGAE